MSEYNRTRLLGPSLDSPFEPDNEFPDAGQPTQAETARIEPAHTDDCESRACNHCTVCGVGVLYGSRCSEHPTPGSSGDVARSKAENGATQRERCPGSLRPPNGTTDLPFNGGKAGLCRRCGRSQLLRQDGSLRVHQRAITPEKKETL